MTFTILKLYYSYQCREGVLAYIQEFNVARNTLHLIYNQTLLWAGLFFCPLTPVIVLLKMAIIFYIQKVRYFIKLDLYIIFEKQLKTKPWKHFLINKKIKNELYVYMIFIFQFTILKFLQPDERPWRAAQTETVFFALTLVSLILSFLGYGFITVR